MKESFVLHLILESKLTPLFLNLYLSQLFTPVVGMGQASQPGLVDTLSVMRRAPLTEAGQP